MQNGAGWRWGKWSRGENLRGDRRWGIDKRAFVLLPRLRCRSLRRGAAFFSLRACGLSGSGGEPVTVIADPNADAVGAQLHHLGAVAALDDVAAGALR